MYVPFAKVLVPIDFSQHSLNALRFADSVVQGKGTLHLIHVLETTPYEFFASMRMLREDIALSSAKDLPPDLNVIKAELEKHLATLAKDKRGGPCTYEVRTGHPVDEILKCAAEQKASMIVMCTHGRTGLSHMAIGSVAERVVRMSPVPVLTTRAELTKKN